MGKKKKKVSGREYLPRRGLNTSQGVPTWKEWTLQHPA